MQTSHQHTARNIPFAVLMVNAANAYINLFNEIHALATQTVTKWFVTAFFACFMPLVYPILWLLYRYIFTIDSTPPENYTAMRTRYDHLSTFLSSDDTVFVRTVRLAKMPFYMRPLLRLLRQYYDRLEVQHTQIQTVLDAFSPTQSTINALSPTDSKLNLYFVTEPEMWQNRHPLYQTKI